MWIMILILWFKIILKVILISDHFLWFDFGHDFKSIKLSWFWFEIISWFYPTLHVTIAEDCTAASVQFNGTALEKNEDVDNTSHKLLCLQRIQWQPKKMASFKVLLVAVISFRRQLSKGVSSFLMAHQHIIGY